MKTCTKCKEVYQNVAGNFYIDPRDKRWTSRCRKCLKSYGKTRYASDRAAIFDQKLRRIYGITLKQYEDLLKSQEGVCAICHEVPEGHWHVDHDHETNLVRGLLCGPCNFGLGNFRDSVNRLQEAISYLGNNAGIRPMPYQKRFRAKNNSLSVKVENDHT